jgi:hypothetical protein
MALEARESQGDWITNRVTPDKIILGQLGDIETGLRQLRRRAPLEVAEFDIENAHVLRAPTPEETLREGAPRDRAQPDG